MIQMRSILEVADNSGAKNCGVLRFSAVRGGGMRPWAISSWFQSKMPCPILKSRGRRGSAVIVRTKNEVKRPDGSYVKFDDNSAVLINIKGNPLELEFLVLSHVNLKG